MKLKYEWNAVCDRCGFEYKNHQLKKEWTGLMTCSGPGTNDCWEIRHPLDFLRARKESNKLPWTRPEASDTFESLDINGNPVVYNSATTGCTVEGQFSQADFGTADCAVVGNVNGSLVS